MKKLGHDSDLNIFYGFYLKANPTMSRDDSFRITSSAIPIIKQPTNTRRTFTLQDKRSLLLKYDSVKDRMSLLQFTAKNEIPRRTFRNWLASRDQLFSADKTSGFNRIKQRKSEHPELDCLLYEWFIDFKKRLNDVPITRDLLLKQAHRLQLLLETPNQHFQLPLLEQPETEEESNDDITQGITSDFEFSPDMLVDSVST